MTAKWIQEQYPVGREIASYPSNAGNFPATVTGYMTYHNLNTWERKAGVCVRVYATTENGKGVELFEDFDPALLNL